METHQINLSSCIPYIELPPQELERLQEGDTLAIHWEAFEATPGFVQPDPYILSRTDMAIITDALDNDLKVLLEVSFPLHRYLLTSVKPMGAENLLG
jgi:hypothetical protein